MKMIWPSSNSTRSSSPNTPNSPRRWKSSTVSGPAVGCMSMRTISARRIGRVNIRNLRSGAVTENARGEPKTRDADPGRSLRARAPEAERPPGDGLPEDFADRHGEIGEGERSDGLTAVGDAGIAIGPVGRPAV